MHYLLIHYDIPKIDEATYELRIEGMVKNKLRLNMENIRARPKVKMPVTMECAGNGRMSQLHRLWVTFHGTTKHLELLSGLEPR